MKKKKPWVTSVPLNAAQFPLPTHMKEVSRVKHENTPRGNDSPSRFGVELSERQFQRRLKREYLSRVADARHRKIDMRWKRALPPIQALEPDPEVPKLDLSFARDLVIETESDDDPMFDGWIIPYELDPFNMLIDPEFPHDSDESYSFESFDTETWETDDEGQKTLVKHHHPHRARHRKRVMVSEASEKPPELVTDSEDSMRSEGSGSEDTEVRNSAFSLSSDSSSERVEETKGHCVSRGCESQMEPKRPRLYLAAGTEDSRSFPISDSEKEVKSEMKAFDPRMNATDSSRSLSSESEKGANLSRSSDSDEEAKDSPDKPVNASKISLSPDSDKEGKDSPDKTLKDSKISLPSDEEVKDSPEAEAGKPPNDSKISLPSDSDDEAKKRPDKGPKHSQTSRSQRKDAKTSVTKRAAPEPNKVIEIKKPTALLDLKPILQLHGRFSHLSPSKVTKPHQSPSRGRTASPSRRPRKHHSMFV